MMGARAPLRPGRGARRRELPLAAETGQNVTIYDVALVAGVAPSTVSRTFSRPGRVNAETAARVRAVADQLGYRVSPQARVAVTARSRMLALVVPDVANPFYLETAQGAQAAADTAGDTLVLVDSRESDRAERTSLDRLVPVVDGIVLAGSRMSDSAIRMIAKQKPVVVVNRAVVDVPCVLPDTRVGMRRAVDHLARLGHVQIAYAAGPEASWADSMRWRALLDAANAAGLRVRRSGRHSPDIAGGEQAADLLPLSWASAVIAYNDQMALGIIRRLQQRAVRVPGHVSVLGFDNIPAGEEHVPPLTTVASPVRVAGEAAVGHLLSLLDGARNPTTTMMLPMTLIERRSTGPRVQVPG